MKTRKVDYMNCCGGDIPSPNQLSIFDIYDTWDSVYIKFMYFIKKTQHSLTTRDLAKLIDNEDITFLDTKGMSELVSKISATLEQKIRKRLVMSKYKEGGIFCYGPSS
ncbi:MAG: hypothetical protein V4561_10655 [Bacteroidota bacterium]